MNDEILQATSTSSGLADTVAAATQTRQAAAASLQPERLTSPAVRTLDLMATSLALALTMLGTFMNGTDRSAASVFSHRVRFSTVLVELGFLVGWRFVFWVMSLYQPRLIPDISTLLWRVPLTVIPATALLIPVLMLRVPDVPLARTCFVFWFLATTLMLSVRAVVFSYGQLVRPKLRKRRSVVICGTGLRARTLALELAFHPEYRYQVLGFVDSTPQDHCSDIAPLLGPIPLLEALLMKLPVDEVIVGLPVKSHFSEIEYIVQTAGAAGVQLQYSMDLFTSETVKHRALDPLPGRRVVLEMVNQDSRLFIKEVVDRTAAAFGLLMLAPLMLMIAIAIRLDSRGPIFFVQKRYGLNKRQFGMIKFRSMVTDAEVRMTRMEHLNETGGAMFKMKNDPRITPIGRFIRRTSLDELPQLINVLCGEMSLVGPRPLPQRDIDHFGEAWLMRRFSVKPGITGLWQVSGRSNTDFDSAIRLDLKYIDHWSLALDTRILVRTFVAVARGSGAY